MEKYAQYFKVFSDPVRLEVIKLLIKGESCSCTMIDQLPISQPTLSYHLKQIAQAGLATSHREGNWIKYHIDKEKIEEMMLFLKSLTDIKTEDKGCKL